MEKEEYIADLYELKMNLYKPLLDSSLIQPNITYSVIETLIAVFMDKYKIDYKKVQRILSERSNQTLRQREL